MKLKIPYVVRNIANCVDTDQDECQKGKWRKTGGFHWWALFCSTSYSIMMWKFGFIQSRTNMGQKIEKSPGQKKS